MLIFDPPPPPRTSVIVSTPTTAGPFTFVGTPLGWVEAEAHCAGLSSGGHLASIRSLEENEMVHGLCAPLPCWIGYNDVSEEGAWGWSDGSAADFSSFPDAAAPWNPGEPNGQAHESTDGAYMYPNSNAWVTAGTWDDERLVVPMAFVCRKMGADDALVPPLSRPTPPLATAVLSSAGVVLVLSATALLIRRRKPSRASNP